MLQQSLSVSGWVVELYDLGRGVVVGEDTRTGCYVLQAILQGYRIQTRIHRVHTQQEAAHDETAIAFLPCLHGTPTPPPNRQFCVRAPLESAPRRNVPAS